MIRVIAGLALAMHLPACVAVPPGADEARAAIVDGEVTSELGAVVAIAPRRVGCGDSADVLCSGTLVTSNTTLGDAADTVLSAAHCFDSTRPGLAYEVFLGEAVDQHARAIPVVEVRTHPDFDAETRENDVAILWLERPANGVSPEVLPEADSALPELGDRVTLAGFGATSAGSRPDGLKRMGIGRVDEVRAARGDGEPGSFCELRRRQRRPSFHRHWSADGRRVVGGSGLHGNECVLPHRADDRRLHRSRARSRSGRTAAERRLVRRRMYDGRGLPRGFRLCSWSAKRRS